MNLCPWDGVLKVQSPVSGFPACKTPGSHGLTLPGRWEPAQLSRCSQTGGQGPTTFAFVSGCIFFFFFGYQSGWTFLACMAEVSEGAHKMAALSPACSLTIAGRPKRDRGTKILLLILMKVKGEEAASCEGATAMNCVMNSTAPLLCILVSTSWTDGWRVCCRPSLVWALSSESQHGGEENRRGFPLPAGIWLPKRREHLSKHLLLLFRLVLFSTGSIRKGQ